MGAEKERDPTITAFSWNLYVKPDLLSITGASAKDDSEWVLLTVRTGWEEQDGVALLPDFVCPACGHHAEHQEDGRCISEAETRKITLKLKIEELPRVIAVLNELYRAVTSKLMVIPEFDKSGEWHSPEWQQSKNPYLAEPLEARREPEANREDWEDRIAVLRGYEVISQHLSDQARKIGLLQPIG